LGLDPCMWLKMVGPSKWMGFHWTKINVEGCLITFSTTLFNHSHASQVAIKHRRWKELYIVIARNYPVVCYLHLDQNSGEHNHSLWALGVHE
jgi:hypothetical protein